MGRLGEFLELFYGPRQLFRTLHARVRHSEPAVDSALARRDGPIGKLRTDLPPKPAREEEFEFWAQLPDRVRFEKRREKEGELKTSLELINGREVWEQHSDGTVEQGSGRRPDEDVRLPTDYQRHFDRHLIREIFAALTLQEIGTSRVANRECVTFLATKVAGASLWSHWLPSEADEYEFAGDLERAVLLSIVCKRDGKAIETFEVVEITFDGTLDESLFRFTPAKDDRVEAAKPVTERISLEAAARRAPFKVFQPAKQSGRKLVEPHVMYYPSRPRRRDESLTIFFLNSEHCQLWINQGSQPDPDHSETLEWTEIERNGRRFKLSDPEVDDGLRVLWFEQSGTHVEIVSDLPVEEMVDLGLGMEEVVVE
jgi:outer membrane lipoprotein-sorting protein